MLEMRAWPGGMLQVCSVIRCTGTRSSWHSRASSIAGCGFFFWMICSAAVHIEQGGPGHCGSSRPGGAALAAGIRRVRDTLLPPRMTGAGGEHEPGCDFRLRASLAGSRISSRSTSSRRRCSF
jgi:hypothetical protein